MSGALLRNNSDLSALPTADQQDLAASFGETLDAARRFTFDEELSYSADAAFEPFLRERNTALVGLGMDQDLADFGDTLTQRQREQAKADAQQGVLLGDDTSVVTGFPSSQAARTLRDRRRAANYYNELQRLAEQNPDSFRGDDDILSLVTEQMRAEREANQAVVARGSGVAQFLGGMQATLTEPYVIASLPLGAGAGTGRSLLAGAGRVFATEAAIAGAVEIPLQAEVLDFKRQIQSPYTMQDAAVNVLAASLGAGAIGAVADIGSRGVGSLVERYTSSGARTPEGDRAARVLQEIEARNATAPSDVPPQWHSDLIDDAMEALEANELPRPAEGIANESRPIAEGLQELDEAGIGDDLAQYVDDTVVESMDSERIAAMRATIDQALTDNPELAVPLRMALGADDELATETVRAADVLQAQRDQLSAVDGVRRCYLGETGS